MFFDGFVAFVLVPAGILLNVMYLFDATSNGTFRNKATQMLEAKPVVIHPSIQIPVDIAIIAITFLLAMSEFNSYRESEDGRKSAQQLDLRNAEKSTQYLHGMWLWQNCFAFILFLFAHRLKGIHKNFNKKMEEAKSVPFKGDKKKFVIGLLVLCLIVDLPITRIHYLAKISNQITPRKTEYIAKLKHFGCVKDATGNDIYIKAATGDCKEWCDKVENLSNARTQVVEDVRASHLTGKIGALIFDITRGQLDKKAVAEELQLDRPCMRLAESCDKSNPAVNGFCWVASIAGLMAIFYFIKEIVGVDLDPVVIGSLTDSRIRELAASQATTQKQVPPPTPSSGGSPVGAAQPGNDPSFIPSAPPIDSFSSTPPESAAPSPHSGSGEPTANTDSASKEQTNEVPAESKKGI